MFEDPLGGNLSGVWGGTTYRDRRRLRGELRHQPRTIIA